MFVFTMNFIVGIAFIITGVCLQLSSFVILFFFSLYKLPQMIISTTIIGFISYFAFVHLDNPIHDFITQLSSKPSREQIPLQQHKHHFLLEILFTLLEYINGIVLRRIYIFIFFILPIVMEMRALILLSSLVNEGIMTYSSKSFLIRCGICWAFTTIQIILFIPMHFQLRKATQNNQYLKSRENDTYQIGPISLILKQNISLFDVRIHAWIYLYSAALLTTTFIMRMNQIHKSIILAAPFLLVTGSFLILSCQQKQSIGRNCGGGDNRAEGELFLNVLRRALKCTLFDVVELVGDDISDNDTLQLNMLQWIVDYWATNSGGNREEVGSTNEVLNNIDCTTGATSSNVFNVGAVSKNTSLSSTGRDQSKRNSNLTSPYGTTRTSNADLKTNTSSIPQQRPRVESRILFPSFRHLDERARPAVLSYKRAIEEFPPSRNTCIILAISKRCPSVIAVASLHLSGSLNANYITTILLPMIILDYMRTSTWLQACHRAFEVKEISQQLIQKDSRDQRINNYDKQILPNEMDPMEILLSTDSYDSFYRGSSVQLWKNIKGSVVRLESSLTAVKCVETANIATDVAYDVLSLAKFGLEVKSKGISHGISVLTKDFLQFHLDKSESNSFLNANLGHHQQEGRYSMAALNIMNNGKLLSKNVSELIDDGNNKQNLLHSFISGTSALFDKGWFRSSKTEISPENGDNNDENQIFDQTDFTDMNYDSNTEKDDENCSNVETQTDVAQINDEDIIMINETEQISSNRNSESFELHVHGKKEQIDDKNSCNLQLNKSKEDDRIKSTLKSENRDGLNSLGTGLAVVAGSLAAEIAADTNIYDKQETHDGSSSEHDKTDDNKSDQSIITILTETQHGEVSNNEKSLDETNDGLNFLGAGLAIVAGAIVGSIALAKKNEGDKKRSDDQHTKAPKLSIELLEDED